MLAAVRWFVGEMNVDLSGGRHIRRYCAWAGGRARSSKSFIFVGNCRRKSRKFEHDLSLRWRGTVRILLIFASGYCWFDDRAERRLTESLRFRMSTRPSE